MPYKVMSAPETGVPRKLDRFLYHTLFIKTFIYISMVNTIHYKSFPCSTEPQYSTFPPRLNLALKFLSESLSTLTLDFLLKR